MSDSDRLLFKHAGGSLRQAADSQNAPIAAIKQHDVSGFRQVDYECWTPLQTTTGIAHGLNPQQSIAIRTYAGWPMFCIRDEQFSYLRSLLSKGRSEHPRGFAYELPEIGSLFPSRHGFVLPYEPIWPGFAINTIFYAAIAWMLFAVPGALRRLRGGRRIKRGLCPACAYPVGDSRVCTECGKAVRS
jgi:hypothetical protein